MCPSVPITASLRCLPDGLRSCFSRSTGTWKGAVSLELLFNHLYRWSSERPVTCGKSMTRARTRTRIAHSHPSPSRKPSSLPSRPFVICSRELDWGLDSSIQQPQTAEVPPSLDLSNGEPCLFSDFEQTGHPTHRPQGGQGGERMFCKWKIPIQAQQEASACCQSLFCGERAGE